jgi:hypothetical protein
MSIKALQHQPVYDAETTQFVPYGSNAAADFFSLVNPAFLTRYPPLPEEVRSVVRRYRSGGISGFYGDPQNKKVQQCVYAFDLRLTLPPEQTSLLHYAELATLWLGGLEESSCPTHLTALEGMSPQEFLDNSDGNDICDVVHISPGQIQICGWGFLKLQEGNFENLEFDLLKGFQFYLCSKNGKHAFVADEGMLIADQSWIVTQPYEVSPALEKHYKTVLKLGTAHLRQR